MERIQNEGSLGWDAGEEDYVPQERPWAQFLPLASLLLLRTLEKQWLWAGVIGFLPPCGSPRLRSWAQASGSSRPGPWSYLKKVNQQMGTLFLCLTNKKLQKSKMHGRETLNNSENKKTWTFKTATPKFKAPMQVIWPLLYWWKG